MYPHFGFSIVTPAHELLWKVSSGPRSEKVARLCVRRYRTNQLLNLYNMELDSDFKWLHFLSIVDEIRDAINDPVTGQVVGNT